MRLTSSFARCAFSSRWLCAFFAIAALFVPLPAFTRYRRRRGDTRQVSTEDPIGLVLAVVVLAYLVYALLAPEKLWMSAAGWLQLLALVALVLSRRDCILGPYLAARFRWQARLQAIESSCPIERVRVPRPSASTLSASSLERSTRSRCSRSAPSP